MKYTLRLIIVIISFIFINITNIITYDKVEVSFVSIIHDSEIKTDTIFLSQNTESQLEELDSGIPIWSVILILAGVVLVILIILLLNFKRKNK